MLIEDAIASLQVHEVPDRAAKMRLYHKVDRAYWGISNPAIDDQARIWRQELNLDERLKLAADLWNTNAHEGRVCAERDGVIGLNGHPAFIKAGTAAPSLDDYVAHVDTMVDKAGIDHVGIGLDFSHPPGHQMPPSRYAKLIAQGVFTTGTLPPPPWHYPIGDARRIADLTEALIRRGWREKDLRKLLGENFLRLFRAVWKPKN